MALNRGNGSWATKNGLVSTTGACLKYLQYIASRIYIQYSPRSCPWYLQDVGRAVNYPLASIPVLGSGIPPPTRGRRKLLTGRGIRRPAADRIVLHAEAYLPYLGGPSSPPSALFCPRTVPTLASWGKQTHNIRQWMLVRHSKDVQDLRALRQDIEYSTVCPLRSYLTAIPTRPPLPTSPGRR